MRFIIISLLSFTLFGCLISEPELEWEDAVSYTHLTLPTILLV